MRMAGESMSWPRARRLRSLSGEREKKEKRGEEAQAPCLPHPGIGNTAFAEANLAGRITWMSLSSTCVLTGAAPWFWPLTNLVGPYGITWPAKVELSIAVMI